MKWQKMYTKSNGRNKKKTKFGLFLIKIGSNAQSNNKKEIKHGQGICQCYQCIDKSLSSVFHTLHRPILFFFRFKFIHFFIASQFRHSKSIFHFLFRFHSTNSTAMKIVENSIWSLKGKKVVFFVLILQLINRYFWAAYLFSDVDELSKMYQNMQ